MHSVKATRTGVRRTAAVVAVAALIVIAGAGPAWADGWTWSSATHPAGAAQVNGGTAGGGVYLYHGVYFLPGVGHMDQPLGDSRTETGTGTGFLGRVAYTTYAGRIGNPDAGLLATGTTPIAPIMRVSAGWPDAPITGVAHPGDVVAGLQVCHSGSSAPTLAPGGYRCGTIREPCTVADTACYMSTPVTGGDSGGPVWWYDGRGGVTLFGWVSRYFQDAAGNFLYSSFVPVWALQNHSWTESQSWTSWDYPAGNDGTGCFVTTSGCVRS